MIITCINCNKKFNIDSNLIPNMGRLLQCASCDHKWFFKNEVLKNTLNPIVRDIDNVSVDIFNQNNPSNNDEINPSNNDEINPSNTLKEVIEVDTEEEIGKEIVINTEEESEKITEVNKDENTAVIAKPKKQKNFKILNIIIVAIISFVALIIIVDTFKFPIGKIVPNIEFILYNLYESIKDISLFIKDLT
jgi:predicted Zn finger-like uncharacterized protein